MGELRFDDRVVIVTGGGRGIGRVHALAFASRGAKVVVADIGSELDGSGSSTSPADNVVTEIEANGGVAAASCASVASEEGSASIINTALQTFGRLDVVVNNAGINVPGAFDELPVDNFRMMIDVHFFGTVFVTGAAWPHLLSAGYGRIVNTVSESMLGGIRGLTSYASAKGAVFAFTRTLATEAEGLGIRVNAIEPRAFTRMSTATTFASSTAEALERAQSTLAPEMNSPGVVFLAHESCPLNGEILRVGMGSVARLALLHTKGIKTNLTPEGIAENLGSILDIEGATETDISHLSDSYRELRGRFNGDQGTGVNVGKD